MNEIQKFATERGIFDALRYGAAEEACIFEKQASEVGYTRISTFFSDLSIAEWYGLDSVKDTYNRVVKSWLGSYKMFTEFVLCLNWKSWECAGRGFNELGQLYQDLYYQADDVFYKRYASDSAEDKAARSYYFEVTD